MTAITITDAAHDYLADLLSKLYHPARHPVCRDVHCLLQAW